MNGSKRVLVTGYGGFLGKEIVRQLLESGYKVRGVARGAYPEIPIDSVRADLAVPVDIRSLAKDCDAIIHTAALAGVWGPWREYYTVNTRATSNLIESAVANGVKCFVHCSSPSVTFDARAQSGIDESAAYPKQWLCHYPHTKALAEQVVIQATKKTPLKACVLRPHLIWGDGDPHLFPRVISRAKQGKLHRVGTGRNLIDVVHVRNAARAHILALERLLASDDAVNGQAFFITDGHPVPCWDWISQILEQAKVPVPKRSISYAAAYRLGALLELAYFALRIRREPPMTRFVAAQLALEHYFAIDKAKRLLGYHPELEMMEKFLGT
jgi:2-alkyl-3-oxoalkanoate reductase